MVVGRRGVETPSCLLARNIRLPCWHSGLARSYFLVSQDFIGVRVKKLRLLSAVSRFEIIVGVDRVLSDQTTIHHPDCVFSLIEASFCHNEEF